MEDRKYSVIVSDRARQMLSAHMRFLAKVNREAASRKKMELLKALKSLSYMPDRFPFLNENYLPQNKYHRMFVEKWYLVIYQIRDENVYVDYILDCRSDYNWLMH